MSSHPDDSTFAAFNRMQGMGTVRDPYPEWADLRREAPVQVGDTDRFLPPGSAALMGERIAVALSFDAVSEVLLDGARFPSSGYARTMGAVMGHTILEMDEPEHHRYRALIQTAFQRKQQQRWEQEIVRPTIEARLERLRGAGRAELVGDLTFPFPVAVICDMIGIPKDEHDTFHRLAVDLISVAFDPPRGLAASQGLGELFAEVLAQRRRQPANDLMTLLAEAELEGTHLEDEQIFAFFRLLAPAGAETTYRSSSNLLYGLLSDPVQLDALRRDPSRIPAAIEEGLRWECPLTGIQRTTARDTEVAGVAIPEGTPVHVCLAAANRDETRWDEPDRFDLFRTQRHHASFAFGPHTCLGMHLARMETRVLLECLFERLPGLRMDPEAEDVHISGRMFRSPLALPVVFDG